MERAQQHRRGRGVRYGVRRAQGLAECLGDPRAVCQRPYAQGAVPERFERRRCGLRVHRCHRGKRVQRPAGGGLGAVGEGLLAGPDDDRRAVVPAVQCVAPVAHIALVVRGVGLEVVCPGGRTHLVLADVQRGRFQPVAVRSCPVRKRDRGLDQLLDLVVGRVVSVLVLSILIVVPVAPALVPVVVVRLVRAVRGLDVREREDGFVPSPLGRCLQQGAAGGVGALQPAPAQRSRGVLVVEEVDEPVRRAGQASAVTAEHGCAEVLPEETGQLADRSLVALWQGGVTAEEQVVGEGDPVPRPDLGDLVPAVGVEGDQRELCRRASVGVLLVEVTYRQLAPGVLGGQRHHQGADHRVVLLAVLVGAEELARLVHQQGMKAGGEFGGDRQAQFVFHRRQNVVQRVVVPPGVDELRRDLPRVADAWVGQRLLAAAKPGGLAAAEEFARLSGRHRERDGPDAVDLEAQHVRTRRRGNAERARHVSSKHPRQLVPRHGRHRRIPLCL